MGLHGRQRCFFDWQHRKGSGDQAAGDWQNCGQRDPSLRSQGRPDSLVLSSDFAALPRAVQVPVICGILTLLLYRYDVDIWGPMAERVAEQVPKGSHICVQGRLNPVTWTNREGVKQTKWKVCNVAVLPNLQCCYLVLQLSKRCVLVQISATEFRFVDRQQPPPGQQQGGWGQAQPQQQQQVWFAHCHSGFMQQLPCLCQPDLHCHTLPEAELDVT